MNDDSATGDIEDTTTKSDKSDGFLSDGERTKIEMIEEYRFEVRKRLEQGDAKSQARAEFWIEKLIAPAAIVLLTVGLSGYLIPKILQSHEHARYTHQVSTQFTDEIAQQSAEMQSAIDANAVAIDTYWADAAGTNAILGEFALKRDLGKITPDEFSKEDQLLENDRKRVNDRMERSGIDYSAQLKKFRPWLSHVGIRLKALYPAGKDRLAVELALMRVSQSVDECDRALERRNEAYNDALNREIAGVKKERELFKTAKLTRQDYELHVNAALDNLRRFKRLETADSRIDTDSISSIVAFVQRVPPVVD